MTDQPASKQAAALQNSSSGGGYIVYGADMLDATVAVHSSSSSRPTSRMIIAAEDDPCFEEIDLNEVMVFLSISYNLIFQIQINNYEIKKHQTKLLNLNIIFLF